MATDRFIVFSKEHSCPSIDDVEKALRAYVTEAGEVTRHHSSLVSVKLVGRPSVVGASFPGREMYQSQEDGRYFEVNITGGVLDVITRRGDEFTSALADGFVEFVTRFWGGRLEET